MLLRQVPKLYFSTRKRAVTNQRLQGRITRYAGMEAGEALLDSNSFRRSNQRSRIGTAIFEMPMESAKVW